MWHRTTDGGTMQRMGASGSGSGESGRRIGPYRVVRELGRGGMGAVYVAQHVELGRAVALKVLDPGSVEGAQRFAREAQAVARVRHPNVVQVHDSGVDAGRAWLAMDLVEGGSLAERLAREGPLEPLVAVGLALPLARALAHAHAQGVLHRDVKPENVLFAADGRPLLADFGLAKDLTERATGGLTETGELLGTPAFMAPEQADGRAKQADARADVYALGATLFAMLTGAPPFGGGSFHALIRDVLLRPAPAPSSLRPGRPTALDAVVLRCLEKDPARRFASCGELARDLEALLARTAPSTTARRGGSGLGLGLGVVGLLALAVALGVVARRARAPSESPPPPPGPAVEPPPPPIAPPPPPLARATAIVDPWAELAPKGDPLPGWTKVDPPVRPFGPRSAGALATDLDLGQVVLFGGELFDGRKLGDTWVWDGHSWVDVTPAESPPARRAHALTWDAARRRVVLFGGEIGEPATRSGDTWTYDGAARRWTPERPVVSPPPRSHSALAYDARREQVVLFGGRATVAGKTTLVGDTWTWDGRAWTEIPTSGPSARRGHAMAWDPARGVVVLFGGEVTGSRSDETWTWDGAAWRDAKPPTRPPARRAPGGLAWDACRRALVLFGGTLGKEGLLGDAWAWDGETWSPLPDAEPRPMARDWHHLAFDPARGRVLLLGGGVATVSASGDIESVMVDDQWER